MPDCGAGQLAHERVKEWLIVRSAAGYGYWFPNLQCPAERIGRFAPFLPFMNALSNQVS